MGIRFNCPNGHKLHVKEYLAGKRGVCPNCGAKFTIPQVDQPPGTEAESTAANGPGAAASPSVVIAVRDSPALQTTSGGPTSSPAPSPPSSGPAMDQAPSRESDGAPPPFDFTAIPPRGSESPVATYTSQRQRMRKTQLRIAIALLLTVIALAAVLVWVLQRGPSAGTLAAPAKTYLAYSPPRAYVAAVGFERTPCSTRATST
jgi:hypothetical protein